MSITLFFLVNLISLFGKVQLVFLLLCLIMCMYSLQQIHTLIMSMSFSGIKIKTINSLESWNGGVLVVASGSVKLRDINGWRDFVQTFLLAPQEKGYFVLNDVFHFVNEEQSEVIQAPVGSQNNLDAQPTSSNPLAEPPGIVTSIWRV